jgi:hypothetical protein
VAVGEFNGDGRPDLLISYEGEDLVNVLLGTGGGTFRKAGDYDTYATSIVVEDFNGDGKADFAAASKTSWSLYNATFSVSVYLGAGDGTFHDAVRYPGGAMEPASLAVGDFDGDGKADLVASKGWSNDVVILRGDGRGSFVPPLGSYIVGPAALGVAVGDFNGDRKPDLAMATYGAGMAVLFNTSR